jgi:hypothetical protein
MPTGTDYQDVRMSSTAPENRQFSNKMPVDPLEVNQGAEDQLAKDLELQHFLMNSGMTPGSRHTDHPMNGPFSPPAPLPQYGRAPEKSMNLFQLLTRVWAGNQAKSFPIRWE